MKSPRTSAGCAAARALCLVLALSQAWSPAWAQIVADPAAPGSQRPTVLTAPNGVPLINITTPSAAGVSRNTRIQSDYASVGEQSGLKAGDGGFDVEVQGRTTLNGGAITSTQAAVEADINRFESAGGTELADVHNSASYEASGASVSAGIGNGKPTGSAGIGSDQGSASSTTRAAISGIAGHTDARTGDAETGLAPIFDKDRVKEEVGAQVAITAAFGSQASKAIGDYAAGQERQARSLRAQADAETDPDVQARLRAEADQIDADWGPQGVKRLLAHAVVGGLTGGAAGAAGAASGTLVAPAVAEALTSAGIDPLLADALTALASTAAGAAVGGTAGGAAAFNEVTNNYLSHDERIRLQRAERACIASGNAEACQIVVQLRLKDELSDRLLADAVARCEGADCHEVATFVQQELTRVGCTAPHTCTDQAQLQRYWQVAQTKAQGLEAVYPEGWLLDIKAVADIAKAGIRLAVNRTAEKSLDELRRLRPQLGGDQDPTPSGLKGFGDGPTGGGTVGELSGVRTVIPPLSDSATSRSLIRENESASILANNGYKVEQNPQVPGSKNPDYRVNGEIFDNYAPSTSNVRNVWSEMERKVARGQADNIVVNLADSSITPPVLSRQLMDYPIPGLKQVIVIDKAGNPLVIKVDGE